MSGGRRVAFVFPGQASQRAGMAAALLAQEPAARSLFQRASEILGLDLAEACTTGSEALLTRTDIAQPALLTTCLGWWLALREQGVEPALAAGHSLGEFSAWVCAGALEFEPALRLVRRRGELMEEAARRRPGGMLAIIGLAGERVEEVCRRAGEGGTLVVANHNCPGQVVISGEEGALERAAGLVRAMGGRAIRLRVSGAFHSPLMEDAALSFSRLVAETPVAAPAVPVVANVHAEPIRDAEGVREAMARQMTSPVLWTDSVRRMVGEGAEVFVEVGPGRVLVKLIARIAPEIPALPVGSPEELEAALEGLSR